MAPELRNQIDALKDAIHQAATPSCFGDYQRGQMAAERDCHTCESEGFCTTQPPVLADTPKNTPAGHKFDDGKPRWDLLPYDAVADVVDVLTHGSLKYGPENWRTVQRWDERYFAAAMRHLSAYRLGSFTDDDSGLPHLAHAACCVLFLLAKEGETR